MFEDKLSQDQRIRLECLIQAIELGKTINSTGASIIPLAIKFENYIIGGK